MRYLGLFSLALLTTNAHASDAPDVSAIDLNRAWFVPALVADNDPVCESVLGDVRQHFRSSDAWNLGRARGSVSFTNLKRLAGPFQEGEPPDSRIQVMEEYPQTFRLNEPDGSKLYVYFKTNPGCGGACESESVLVSDQPLFRHSSQNDKDRAATTPATGSWSLYRNDGDARYVAGLVEGHLQVYRIVSPKRWHVSCDVAVQPDRLLDDPDPAVRAVLETLGAFKRAIEGLTRGAGACGSMDTAGRWSRDQQDALYEALYRPWAMQASAAKGIGYVSENSWGDYSRIREQLKTWSLGGLLEHQAYDVYIAELARATEDVGRFYTAKFGWPTPQAKQMAEGALTTAVSVGMGFYMYEPYPVEEAELRSAILTHQPMSDIQVMPLTGIPLDTILDSAVMYPEALRFLLDGGANPDWTNAFGKTSLMYAAQYNQRESAEILLAYGADPNAATVQPEYTCSTLTTTGMTPLHYAARYGSKDLIELLLAKGALTFSNSSRGYPVDWLHQYGDPASTERNPNLSPGEVLELSGRLNVPDPASLDALSGDLTQRAERDYAAGRVEQAYRQLVSALRANPNNEDALVDFQLVALKAKRLGPSLEAGEALLAKNLSPKMQANVWFNKGLACEAGWPIEYNGTYYCGGDRYRPFLRSWQLSPSGTRSDKLQALFQAVTPTTCSPSTGEPGKELYHFVFRSLSDEGRSGYIQRIYVYHSKARDIDPNDIHWTVRLPDGGRYVIPKILQRYELGESAVTLLESESMAQGAVTIGDEVCHPYN
jgi:tetratricopeptide (TPR) repeat protein